MSKKIKALIAVGGTGGHVFPGCNLAEHLITNNFNVELVTDRRGYKYLEQYKYLKINIIDSKPFIFKNIFTIIVSTIFLIYSLSRSLFFLLFNRPTIIFGMGGYASFPFCIAACLLRIKFIIYENNLILGKSNKYLLPFTKKIFVSYKDLEGIQKKFNHKVVEIGNIIKKEIIKFSNIHSERETLKRLDILVLGGSQAAKVFAETLPNIFCECSKKGINLKIYQHCLAKQNAQLKLFYEKHNIDYELFNFSNNLIEFFSKSNLAITRSGSSVSAELINTNIPFISVPLPTAADNHQLKNAIYFKKKGYSLLIEEKDLNEKLFYHIKDIYEDSSILGKIKQNQRQYSDKNVYNNINEALKEILNEKN